MSTKHLPKAFNYAYNGFRYFIKTEKNAVIQLSIALLVIIAAIWLKVQNTQLALLLICIALVISLEMINTAIENLCNHIDSAYNSTIKIVKDVAAASVLWASFISMLIALLIFLPKIF